MPDISLNTLKGIPGVKKEAMQQNSDNACGAYAIIAAVGAFGVFPVEKKLSYANNGPESVNKEGNTKKEDDYHKLSAAAYVVTGILNNASGTPVSLELKASGNVYNSPAAMAKVALDFGKKVEINVQ